VESHEIRLEKARETLIFTAGNAGFGDSAAAEIFDDKREGKSQ